MIYRVSVASKVVLSTRSRELAAQVYKEYRKLYAWNSESVRASYALVR